MSPQELSACIEQSHRFGLEVTAHAYGDLSVDQCLEAGVDCIEHGFFMSARPYARGAELGRWVVPTLGVFLAEPGIPELPHWSPPIRERLRGARDATWKSIGLLKASGMRFALSTDANHGGFAYEGVYAAMGGMTDEEALAGLTAYGGRLCGKPDEIGVLKPGAYADILAVEGDPLRDLRALLEVRRVLKGGVEVYPTIEPCGPWVDALEPLTRRPARRPALHCKTQSDFRPRSVRDLMVVGVAGRDERNDLDLAVPARLKSAQARVADPVRFEQRLRRCFLADGDIEEEVPNF